MRRARGIRGLTAPALTPRRVRGGIGLMAGVAVVGLMVSVASQPPLPSVGDHWHASYLVVVCGKPIVPFPYTPGDVHTHGDGFVHVHPTSPAAAGRNATLAKFFAGAGAELTRDHVQLPDGKMYRNGDRCNDGTAGQVRVTINGRASDAFEKYVSADGDAIVVQFGPPQ